MNSIQEKSWQKTLHKAPQSFILQGKTKRSKKDGEAEGAGNVFLLFTKDPRKIERALKTSLNSKLIDRVKKNKNKVHVFELESGPVIVGFPGLADKAKNKSQLVSSEYGQVRDQMGSVYSLIRAQSADKVCLHFIDASKTALFGALVGLDIAHYSFKSAIKGSVLLKKIWLLKNKGVISNRELEEAAHLAAGVNMARHLVNMPPNVLNPLSYAAAVKKLFSGKTGVTVDVWTEARMEKEGMGLIRAVGQASVTPPRLVHIKYRPRGTTSKQPVAFLGKGITFDSGGLDLKPPAGMRNMKKDMGGSAAVVGLAHAVVNSSLKVPMDFYLCLAENSVHGNAFRPGDVHIAKNGIEVEIDNTDAEGRLVMADGLCVATGKKAKDQPKCIIDVATLTGAIKVGLGADVAGMFCNSDRLSKQIEEAAGEMTERMWRMPLYDPYLKTMSTPVADTQNSASGFGGAITAALFLQKFVGDVPWAHLDVYAWTDGPKGALLEKGGNGQAVQGLFQWCRKFGGK